MRRVDRPRQQDLFRLERLYSRHDVSYDDPILRMHIVQDHHSATRRLPQLYTPWAVIKGCHVYIIPEKYGIRMSALVWATESAILGLWALVYSLYSNPFHAFIARSHALISASTLLLQLFAAARNLPIEHAISEAFVCAVSSQLLIYITVFLDPGNYSALFTMSNSSRSTGA